MCNGTEEPLDPTATFLERAFRFYDVIAALSNGTAPLSAAPAAGCLVPLPPLGAPTSSPLSSVDTLLGMATTLWPIMHRLSTLPSLKAELDAAVGAGGGATGGRAASSSAKIAVLRTEFEMSASSVEGALRAWQPHAPAVGVFAASASHDDLDELHSAVRRVAAVEAAQADFGDAGLLAPPAEGTEAGYSATHNRLQSILHNALAYKHSALVYLYRTVHELERSDEAVQRHARAALRHCAGTVSARGPMGALLWPLFVAACEAVAGGDRALARQTFLGVERRQGMMNIERAWEIVQEVWRRADEVEGEHAGSPLGEFPMISFEALFGPGQCLEPTGLGCAGVEAGLRQRKGRGADLWRRVSEDMGVNIVFG